METLTRVEYYVPPQGSHDERILATAAIPAELLTQLAGETVLANLKPRLLKILQVALVKELWRAKWSKSRISRMVGVNPKTVYLWKKKHGWEKEEPKHYA